MRTNTLRDSRERDEYYADLREEQYIRKMQKVPPKPPPIRTVNHTWNSEMTWVMVIGSIGFAGGFLTAVILILGFKW